jgi:hypothetical protein
MPVDSRLIALPSHVFRRFLHKKFELKIVAYQRGRTETDECRILIFVENTQSFTFLYDLNNWPATLSGYEFSTKCPSIAPQSAVFLPALPIQVEWNDFAHELKDKYPSTANIIRLKKKHNNRYVQ